jgi:hypothetical protein
MHFYNYHQLTQHSGNFSSFLGGFSGASFAFIFGLITYAITKRRERFIQHKNSLVKLNRLLMSNLHDFGVIWEVSKDMIKSLKQNHTTASRLNLMTTTESFETEIGSIDLVNMVFEYRMSINKLNFNLKSINHTLNRLEDLYINGQPVLPINFSALEAKMEHLIKESAKLNEWTKKLLVIDRIHQSKTSGRSSYIYGVINTQWEQNISKEEKLEGYKALENEVAELEKKLPDDIF